MASMIIGVTDISLIPWFKADYFPWLKGAMREFISEEMTLRDVRRSHMLKVSIGTTEQITDPGGTTQSIHLKLAGQPAFSGQLLTIELECYDSNNEKVRVQYPPSSKKKVLYT